MFVRENVGCGDEAHLCVELRRKLECFEELELLVGETAILVSRCAFEEA